MDRKTLFVDCDDTLLMHDLSEFPREMQVTLSCNGRSFTGVPNTKNVSLLIKFYKLGYDVYVWSKTGESWARSIVKTLKLTPYVRDCMAKPDFYMDDKDVTHWMGFRVYRDPKTGKGV